MSSSTPKPEKKTIKCSKVRYKDKIAAMMALASTSKARTPRRDEKKFYPCPKCKGWHLTSKAKSWKDEV